MTGSNEKKIIIADDHPLMAEGLTSIIHEHTPYRVMASVHDGRTLLHLLNSVVPDLLILDLNMPQVDGIEAARQVKIRYPKIKILCVSMHLEPGVYKMLDEIKVDGFIPKLTDTQAFIDVISKVMNGEKIFLKAKAAVEAGRKFEGAGSFALKAKLSNREIEILRLIKKGEDSQQIAAMLNLSYYTVETHRKNICKKLDIHSPNSLLKYAAGLEL